MIRIRYFAIFLIGFFAYSQNYNNDFLYDTKEKVYEFMEANNDSSKIIINQYINSKDDNYKSFGYVLKSLEYFFDNDLEKFNKNINKSVVLLKNKNDLTSKKITAYALNIRGVVYTLNGQNDKGIYNFNEAKKIATDTNELILLFDININIAKIYDVIGKTDKAIEVSYENLKQINNKVLISKLIDEAKTKFYSNFGSFYNNLYYKTKKNSYLDSSLVYFKKAIIHDIYQTNETLNFNIGDLLYSENNFEEAKRYYQQGERIAIKNNKLTSLSNAFTHLAEINYELKNFKEAIKYCERLDSIYKLNKIDDAAHYVFSNFLQSEIYKKLGNTGKQKFHHKIYSDITKKHDLRKVEDSDRMNMILNFIEKEEQYQKKIDESKRTFFTRKKITLSLIVLFTLLILYYLYRKLNIFSQKTSIMSIFSVSENLIGYQKESKEMSLDKEQEKRILNKIMELENEKFFLNVDFNQKTLAKKINTNTTYLSYVFNKNFDQNFNTYYNDLKINYAIERINTDKKFREYSTLAIAESVGFKNADSFTSSFKKKIGKTPFQYINQFKNNNL